MSLLRAFVVVIFLALALPCGWADGEPAHDTMYSQGEPLAVDAVAHAGETESHGLPQSAAVIGHVPGIGLPITNSMVVTWIVAAGLILFARIATRKMQAVPSGAQNFWEWMVESLYEFLEEIVGRGLIRKTFWFFATLFIFILFTNWFGLIPGVGTIGWGEPKEGSSILLAHVSRPLLRGGNADLNMPLAMAMLFFFFWTIWAFQVNGVKGVFAHIFGLKGDVSVAIRYFMMVIFFAVGFIEILSICFRPIALTFRLYGNIFAGENLLEAMSNVVTHPAWAKAVFSVLLPVPFYFMEILVGFVQALVFMLLCAVFTAVMCKHDEEPGKEHH
jgi:F-type H+-transporting ATPase subunit a